MAEEDRRNLDGDSAVAAAEKDEVQGYNCGHCQKVFSSGRALARHRTSVHRNFKKPNKPNPRTGQYVCDHCGKEFQSVKAVQGHMGMHPSSHRRWTKPPTEQDQIENQKSDEGLKDVENGEQLEGTTKHAGEKRKEMD